MSKMYDKYEELKEKDNNTIYLFLCGNFYIALDSDAIILNEMFSLKLTKFSNFCDKCGFPKNSLEKYKTILDSKNIKYKIIEQIEKSNDLIVKSIKLILDNNDIDNLNKEDLSKILLTIKELIGE